MKKGIDVFTGDWSNIGGIFIVGVIFVTLGVLSGTGRLRRNSLAGIRVGSIMASDDSWRAGHKAAAPLLLINGAMGLALSLGLTLAGLLQMPWLTISKGILYGYLILVVAILIPATLIALKAANGELRSDAGK